MEYQIFIEAEGASAPYFEPIFAHSLDEARATAEGLLRAKASGKRAMIYDANNLLAVVGED